LFEPLNYADYVNLVNRAYLVVSDSGGIQEEAPALGVPVIVCREKTERPEAVEAGTVALVGTSKSLIADTIEELLEDNEKYTQMATAKSPFGDGQASRRIVEALMYHFGLSDERPDEFETFL
jgi:UDP-N-acetylglucosamine 2-epimerase (non-hydrolysing)